MPTSVVWSCREGGKNSWASEASRRWACAGRSASSAGLTESSGSHLKEGGPEVACILSQRNSRGRESVGRLWKARGRTMREPSGEERSLTKLALCFARAGRRYWNSFVRASVPASWSRMAGVSSSRRSLGRPKRCTAVRSYKEVPVFRRARWTRDQRLHLENLSREAGM